MNESDNVGSQIADARFLRVIGRVFGTPFTMRSLGKNRLELRTRGKFRSPAIAVVLCLTLISLAMPAFEAVAVDYAANANNTSLISKNSSGVQGNNHSRDASISASGRYVAFNSNANNLVSGDTNGTDDIFVHDRGTGATTRVSVSTSGAQADAFSRRPSISADGRFVTFWSLASNLVADDSNGTSDVFIHDRETAATTRVSLDSGGGNANHESTDSSVSSDGRYVSFYSKATDLVSGDRNRIGDIFVRDRLTGVTKIVSLGPSGDQAEIVARANYISADGRFIAFRAEFPGGNQGTDIFVRDRVAGTTTKISFRWNQFTTSPVAFHMSADSRVLAWVDNGGTTLINRITGEARRIGDLAWGGGLVLSPNGDLLAYPANYSNDIRIYHAATGSETNVAADGWPGGFSDLLEFAFQSELSTIVANDTNSAQDIFVYDPGVIPSASAELTFGSCDEGIHSINPSACLDSVNSATGSYVRKETDAKLAGIGIPFEFSRTYTSVDNTEGVFGFGWSHSLSARLDVQPNGDVILRGEDGQRTYYTSSGGTLKPSSGGRSTLTAVSGGYELVRQDQTKYRFDTGGRLTQLRDRNNQGLTLGYDLNLRLVQVTDSGGRLITLTYDGGGRLSSLSFPQGRQVTYGYTAGLLTSVTDARGGVTRYTHDADGKILSVIDANNHTEVRNTYDAAGSVIEQLDALDNKTTFSWDSTTRTRTKTDPRGNQWKDVYSNNVIVKRVDPLGNITSYTYDSQLNQIGIADPRGGVTRSTYDSRGNLLSRTGPSPSYVKESWTYDMMNNVTSHTDGRGNVTTSEYDASGNLIKTIQPGSIVTQYGRDPNGTGLLTSTTDPRGKITTFEYDAQGNRVRSITPMGFITSMTYDSAGRLTSEVEPRGNVVGANPDDYRTTMTYDASDNLTGQTDPLGNSTTFAFDLEGNRTSTTDAKSRTTSFGYDKANRLLRVTAADTTVTIYGYDPNGNLSSRTDAKQRVSTYEYDSANRLTAVVSPTGQRWTYQYDANGNRSKMVDANGNSTPDPADGTISYGFDELNRRVSVDYSDTTPDVTLSWDANGNRTSMTDGSGTQSFAYDALNRLTSTTRGNDAFSYTYDPAGNVTRRVYPDSTAIDYTFDDDGRLSSVTSGTSTTTYSYDATGNPVQTTLPSANGHIETRTYDRGGRVTEVRNSKAGLTLSLHTYTLDQVGNPTAVLTESESLAYSFDSQDRLAEVCYAASCSGAPDYIRYTYDEVGNRLTEGRPSGATTYSYNAADQLLSQTGPSGTTTFSYDQNGNETAAGTKTFTYDLSGRTKTATVGSTTVTYSYDGEGRRLQASTGSQANKKTNFLWDVNGELPELALERDGNNALLRRYVQGLNLISMTTGGADYYYHSDRIGSVTNVTDAAGLKQWTYKYEPFGSLRSEIKNSTLAPTNLMRFAGELFDTQTGLYHLRARQYDPVIGRFLQTDPVPSPLTDPYVSSYTYVGNRPTVLVDPSGEVGTTPWWRTALKVGVIIGGIAGAVACGATVVCGVLVGAAAGAASYAATNAGTRNWNWAHLGIHTGVGALTGGRLGGRGIGVGNTRFAIHKAHKPFPQTFKGGFKRKARWLVKHHQYRPHAQWKWRGGNWHHF